MKLPSRNSHSSSSVSDVVSGLHNITPDWGISLFNMLNGTIKLLDNKLIKFNSNLQKSMDTTNNALRKAEENQSTIQ